MIATKNKIYVFLSSIRFTIFLLSFIAFGSIFGTIIKQGVEEDEYLSIYSNSAYAVIRSLGLDDVYHSSWFTGAMVLFALNLALCTYGRFIQFIKSEKKINLPDEKTLSSMSLVFFVGNDDKENALSSIKEKYRTLHEEQDGLLLQKGFISRFGVFIIHGSILVILAGSLTGLLFGYKGYMTLQKGEIKDHFVLKGSHNKTEFLGFSLKCNDFQASFYESGQPKDYVSMIEVIENNNVILKKNIKVNNPLSYKGINIYQSSYGNSPSFLFTVAGEKIKLNERESYKKDNLLIMVMGFENSVHNFGPGVLVAYLDEDQPKTTWFLKNVETLKEQEIQGIKIKLIDIKSNFYTGLEIIKDPGLWIVWTGFALMLFGLYVNFFIYYRRFYIRYIPDGLIVAGFALKNREGFKEEFEKLKKKVSGYGS